MKRLALSLALIAALMPPPTAGAKGNPSMALIVQFNSGNPYAFPEYESTSPQTAKSAVLPSIAVLNQQADLQYYRALWFGTTGVMQNAYRMDFPDGADLESIRELYAADPNVVAADIDPQIGLLAEPRLTTPDDFWWKHTFSYLDRSTCPSIQDPADYGKHLWHLKKLGYERVWPITTGDSTVVVAVIDSGMDRTNPELAPLLFTNPGEIPGNQYDDDHNDLIDDVQGWDFGDGDNDVQHPSHWWQRPGWDCVRPTDDECRKCFAPVCSMTVARYDSCFRFPRTRAAAKDAFGTQRHGTQMASIIASRSNNPDSSYGGNVTGATWRTKILPIKVGCDSTYALPDTTVPDTRPDVTANYSDAVSALEYVRWLKIAGNVNIRAINMSITMDWRGDFSWVSAFWLGKLYEVIQSLRDAGVVPVGGAGNAHTAFPVLPCRAPGVLCAGAVAPDSLRHKWEYEQWTTVSCDDPTQVMHIRGSNYGAAGTDPVNGVPYEGVDIAGYTTLWGESGVSRPPDPIYGIAMLTPGFEPWNHPLYSFCSDSGTVFTDTTQWHITAVTPMYTSGASAQATALVATIASVYPSLSPGQIEAMIKRGAVPAAPGYEGLMGAGAMDAYRSLTLWGSVPRDTTLAGKVYLGGSVVVPAGVTVTLAAGTEVLVAADEYANGSPGLEGLGIYVGSGGALVVNGGSENPVAFRSWAAHDTTGNWEGIYVASGGSLEMHNAVIKHATQGIATESHQCVVADCRIDSCVVGLSVSNADYDTVRCTNVVAVHCTKGIAVSSGVVELNQCRADSNVYGCYIDGVAIVAIHNNTRVCDNTMHGMYVNALVDVGPSVTALRNGQYGVYIAKNQQGTCIHVDGLVSEYNYKAGLRVDYTDRVEVANSALRSNYDNVLVKYATARVVLGDVAQGRGRYNAITDPGRYHIRNEVSGVTLMAEDCYFGYCDDETMPYVQFYGLVDMQPYFCSDPQEGKRLQAEPVVAVNWVGKNYPNPFNPMTRIDYQVADTGERVEVIVFDVAGRRVRSLVSEPQVRGDHWVVWNGCGDSGRPVGAGVYFYSVKIGRHFTATGKMILIK